MVLAREAVRLGMADQIGTLDRAISLALPPIGGRRAGNGKATPAASTLEARRRRQKVLAAPTEKERQQQARRRRLQLERASIPKEEWKAAERRHRQKELKK